MKEIDYFSTVSGGGLAAGNYFALLKKKGFGLKNLGEFWQSDEHYFDKNFDERMRVGTKKRYLITRFGRERINYSHEILHQTLLLKEAKPRKNLKGKDLKKQINLGDIFIEKESSKEVKFPFLIANASIYTNGDLFPIMPHVIKELGIVRFQKPNFLFAFAWKVKNRNFGQGFPLQYALGTSSAFPGMLPVYNYSLTTSKVQSKERNQIIKAFDGGLVDNLGVNSLSEIIKKDTVAKIKKAIIVNNSGSGTEPMYTDLEKLKIGSFLKKSALYAVDININQNEQKLRTYFGDSNHVYLNLSGYKKLISTSDSIKISKEAKKFIDLKKTWDEFENELIERIRNKKIPFKGINLISTIKKEDFEKLDALDVFYIFELACNVETKLKTEDFEREVLILAGRYMVFKKEEDIITKIYK